MFQPEGTACAKLKSGKPPLRTLTLYLWPGLDLLANSDKWALESQADLSLNLRPVTDYLRGFGKLFDLCGPQFSLL